MEKYEQQQEKLKSQNEKEENEEDDESAEIVSAGEAESDGEEWEEDDLDESEEFMELLKQDSLRAREYAQLIQQATSEEEIISILSEKIRNALVLDPQHNCLFCPRLSESLDDNLKHMTHTHGFYIPDIEYLTDVEGLLKHLGQQISVKNQCIFCGPKGRSLSSVEAVWKHMHDKCHQKIAYDTEQQELAVADFYDFSETWMDVTDENADMELVLAQSKNAISPAVISEDEMHLTLPGKQKTIGHRSMNRYYKQYIRFEQEEQESLVLSRTAERYRQLQTYNQPQLMLQQTSPMSNPQVRFALRQQRDRQEKKMLSIGRVHNNQKHYRDEMLQ